MTSRDLRAEPRIPTGVWVLGFVSLLMDTSSELIHGLLPVFLVSVLGASALTLGIIEGTAEATALIVRVFSGALSDYFGHRKALVVTGYAIAAFTKPLFAIATGAGTVLAARLMDRLGKGIRGAPRDALIADLTPESVRGAAYGLRQSLDTVGAFTGPLLAIALMILWQDNIRAVFWIAVIPAVLSVALLWFGVREPERSVAAPRANPVQWRELRRLTGAYWWVVAVGALFTLARFSEAFLILRAQQSGLPIAFAPLVLVAMNLVYASSAYPFGRLADRMNHIRLLVFGLAALIAADLFLALGSSLVAIFFGVMLWGLHMGMTQGLLATMVAATATADLRGTAFGLFNLLSGVTMLIASVLAGLLWDRLGPAYTFAAGALFCLLCLAGIAFGEKRREWRYEG